MGTPEWELDQVFDIGSKATGTTVLRDLHETNGRQNLTAFLISTIFGNVSA